jgi:internalin A
MRRELVLIAGLSVLAVSLLHETEPSPAHSINGQVTQNEQEGSTAVDGEPIACTIRAEPTCALGSAPKISVELLNRTKKPLYLLGSLDGSDEAARYPHCVFEILGPKGRSTSVWPSRCGNMNPLQKEDFILVPAGGRFNPCNPKSSFASGNVRPASFPVMGEYRIRFIYSTGTAANWNFVRAASAADAIPQTFLDRLPKITVASNEIRVRVGPETGWNVDRVLAVASALLPSDPDALRQIERLGGKIRRDDGSSRRPVVEVDFDSASGFKDENIHLLKALEDLRVLNFNQAQITYVGMLELKELKNLTTLRLSACSQISEAGLAEVGSLTNLTSLDLSYTPTTDAVLKDLHDLKHLQTLKLGGTQVTDAGLKDLAEFREITTLSLSGTTTTAAGLKELRNLPRLTNLNLEGRQLTSDDLDQIGQLKHLKTLSLWSTGITDRGLQKLRPLENLMIFAIPRAKISDAGLSELRSLGNLSTLNLMSTQITDGGLAELAELEHLTTLDISDTLVTDAGLHKLRDFTSLQSLAIGASRISDLGLKEIAKLGNLRVLRLWHDKITDAGLRELHGLTRLTELDVSDSQITDAGLQHLSGLSNLEILSLWNTDVTDAGLKDLSKLKSLKTLFLVGTKTTPAGVRALRAALPNLKVSR